MKQETLNRDCISPKAFLALPVTKSSSLKGVIRTSQSYSHTGTVKAGYATSQNLTERMDIDLSLVWRPLNTKASAVFLCKIQMCFPLQCNALNIMYGWNFL